LIPLACAGPLPVQAQDYTVTNLVADVPGAANLDTNLVNAWGLVVLSQNKLIVNANENSIAGLYGTDGQPAGSYLAVDSAPSGLIWNHTRGFKVSDGEKSRPSTLIFVTEEGKILGWNEDFADPTAVVAVDNSGFDAVYKGVAMIGNRLFAADFKGGVIDIYDSKWNWLGAFTDSHVDEGFGPFNVAAVNGLLYVTFAKRLAPDFHDDEAGPGNGFVDVFNANGRFLRRLVSHGVLNSPWGIAQAPAKFGRFSKALLVGNFGDGTINAFDINTGSYLGTLSDSTSVPLVIDGLWALDFGTTKVGMKSIPALFFSAGPGGEGHGLVGKITAN
ncbi:MAG TPA: TIGR03118 family protein, partial [Candidatus Acidoferrum sp.]|nr:TIGR03118 family protein [Candidatus Acidoferrum sp.]